MHTCMCARTCACMYVCTQCTYIHIHVFLRMYIHMYVRKNVCVCMCVCLYMYVHRSLQRMCMVAEPYSVSYDWTQIVCGASGTIAAVAKQRCLCDVNWCLAVDQRRLQGSSSQTDTITLIQFHIVLNKSALEWCWRKVEGHQLLHMKLFASGWTPFRMAGKTDDAPHNAAPTTAMDECQVEKWYLSLNISSVFDKSKLASHAFEKQHKIDWTNTTILQFEPNSIQMIWKGSTYVMF